MERIARLRLPKKATMCTVLKIELRLKHASTASAKLYWVDASKPSIHRDEQLMDNPYNIRDELTTMQSKVCNGEFTRDKFIVVEA